MAEISKEDLKHVKEIKVRGSWVNVIGYSTEECGLVYTKEEGFLGILGLDDENVRYYQCDILNPKMQTKPPYEYSPYQSESFNLLLMVKDDNSYSTICKTNILTLPSILENLCKTDSLSKYRVINEETEETIGKGVFCTNTFLTLNNYNLTAHCNRAEDHECSYLKDNKCKFKDINKEVN